MKRSPIAPLGLLSAALIAVCAVAVWAVAGCAGSVPREKLDLAGIGLSMQLPPGWQVDDSTSDSAVMSVPDRPDSVGSVFRFPLEGASLGEYVQSYSPYAQVSTPRTVGNLEAIETLERAPARTLLTTYIRKGSDVIVVTLEVAPEDFGEAEKSMRAAMATIAIR